MPAQLLFLPGASGDTSFWRPVAEALGHPAPRVFIGWPGFGPTPADPDVRSMDDLLKLVLGHLDTPCALVAQSMGGPIAIRAALARPELVTQLVLCATSGGLDMAAFGAQDWRPSYRKTNPSLPPWFIDERRDLSPHLHRLTMPVLLLWGDRDPISPVALGESLATRLPHATLVVLEGGAHDVGRTHAAQIAPVVDHFLARRPPFNLE